LFTETKAVTEIGVISEDSYLTFGIKTLGILKQLTAPVMIG